MQTTTGFSCSNLLTASPNLFLIFRSGMMGRTFGLIGDEQAFRRPLVRIFPNHSLRCHFDELICNLFGCFHVYDPSFLNE